MFTDMLIITINTTSFLRMTHLIIVSMWIITIGTEKRVHGEPGSDEPNNAICNNDKNRRAHGAALSHTAESSRSVLIDISEFEKWRLFLYSSRIALMTFDGSFTASRALKINFREIDGNAAEKSHNGIIGWKLLATASEIQALIS